ncbi:outer membrane beta-barrel protein [Dyadobacter sediminis]|uniref:Porin family protein n=2 Tax=Dyadobacter sediminis TaxID=1493691 RepID=A0A5R9KCE4_9BACT|nr:outer membrane beta-barrel protein [Dyadobacter sediminis]TLU92454.1 porin family protein [Dyadobacter sediminis]
MNRIFSVFLLIFLLNCMQLSAQDPVISTEWRKEPDSTAVQPEEETAFADLSRIRFGVNGGYGYRLFRSVIGLNVADQKYVKDLKSGIAFGGELTYFFWKKFGIGLNYDRYLSKAENENDLGEDVMIQFFGGSVTHRSVSENGRNIILSSLLVGYQPYRNYTFVGNENVNFTANTMGWGISAGVEHRFSRKFAMNLTGTAIMGAVYRLKRATSINTETLHLSKDDSVDLSRVSISLGFKLF